VGICFTKRIKCCSLIFPLQTVVKYGISKGNGSDSDCFTAPRAVPYEVLLFLFCTDFMGQQKGGFEQPMPRALRPTEQKRPGGAFLGRGLANPFGTSKSALQCAFVMRFLF